MSIKLEKHDCSKELRSLKLKATPARLAILKLLENSDKPIDAGVIFSTLQEKGIQIDPVTVFRIINLFTQKGLARQFHFNEGKSRYEIASKADQHHHLVCQECGQIDDIEDPLIKKVEEKIVSKKGFLIKSRSIEFFGVCTSCQK